MRVLTAAQMREADRYTIETLGLPSIVLMENAGHRVVEAIQRWFGPLTGWRLGVLCGRGNNGGDGLVVARWLSQEAVDLRTFVFGRRRDLRADAAVNLEVVRGLGLPVVHVAPEQSVDPGDSEAMSWAAVRPDVLACDLIVDALLGTGLDKPLGGQLLDVVAALNGSRTPVVSIDLPTGLSADRADPIGEAVQASLTVTLGAPKPALVLPPADASAGEVVVADIGIPAMAIDRVEGDRLELLTPEELRWLVPPRSRGAHKGTFGHVLVVAGSEGKTGAAALAGLGALRSGAGLVTIATPRRCLPAIAAMAPEYMTLALPETDEGGIARGALEMIQAFDADVVAVGPGLGTGPEVAHLVSQLVERGDRPMVFDADAITVLAGGSGRLVGGDRPPIVLTPHPGEMARLTGLSTAEVQTDRVGVARRFATGHGVTVVLKGAGTLVASPDGVVAVNPTGNPGMGTGGVGDVLTGVTAAWIAQLADPTAACRLAVYLHGLAGDLAVETRGESGLIASDVVDALGAAAMALSGTSAVVDPQQEVDDDWRGGEPD